MRLPESNRPHKIRTTQNSYLFQKTYEITNLPSETVPDQTMSMRTIVERYARGLPITGSGRTPIWAGGDDLTYDDYLPPLTGLDPADRQSLMELAKQELESIREKHAEAVKQRNARKATEKTELEKFIQEKIEAAGLGKTPQAKPEDLK